MSVHGVVAEENALALQLRETPSQSSAGSHSPVEARQTKPEGRALSAGQAPELPVHRSATSQFPDKSRQITVDGSKAWA